MAATIQLVSFRLIRLNLNQDPFEQKTDQPVNFETGYDILPHQDNPDLFLMVIRIKGNPGVATGETQGPAFEIAGVGEFKVPAQLSPIEKYTAVAVNGGSMLYGLIRGQMMVITGSFPSGSVLLPTLNWKETVEEIEKKRAAIAAVQEGVSPASVPQDAALSKPSSSSKSKAKQSRRPSLKGEPSKRDLRKTNMPHKTRK